MGNIVELKPTPVLPKKVAERLLYFKGVADRQGSDEFTILSWFVEHVQESDYYTDEIYWIENHFTELAYAIQYGRYVIGE